MVGQDPSASVPLVAPCMLVAIDPRARSAARCASSLARLLVAMALQADIGESACGEVDFLGLGAEEKEGQGVIEKGVKRGRPKMTSRTTRMAMETRPTSARNAGSASANVR